MDFSFPTLDEEKLKEEGYEIVLAQEHFKKLYEDAPTGMGSNFLATFKKKSGANKKISSSLKVT